MHLIVGDGHFIGAPGEGERWAALLARARDAGVRELSVLGDLFELWIGLAGLEQPWQEQIFAPLRALRDAGVKLRYVVGNKDYFVEDWNRRHALFHEVWDPGGTVASPGGPVHLAHGDLVNRADRQYRTWRWLSRSLLFSVVMRLLPRAWLARVSERVARGMQGTNRYHKSYYPEAQLRARAREVASGVMVFGHFHVHRSLSEGAVQVVTLPFLGAENAGIVVDSVGVRRFPGA